ncbi:MAG: UDP-N-acetylmuramate--L-alanine ligase [Flavobacteriaceae bacterium]|nr:UDP-N-acetylmuramate--L-alanine ligase [Flavobacteriaceae bacterium]
MNLDKIDNIFFIGIGGMGMSSLAEYFINENKYVCGYDRDASENTDRLQKLGIEILFKDSFEKVNSRFSNKDDTLIVYTPAIPASNNLLSEFSGNKFACIKRAELLGLVVKKGKCIAIAGTHGKTTTTSILAHLLNSSNISTTSFIGGISENYNSNFLYNGNKLFLVEADEYDKSFLNLTPNYACITSIDPDHLDIYNDFKGVESGFISFINNIQSDGFLIVQENLDYDYPKYGLSPNSDYSIENIRIQDENYLFDIRTPESNYKNLKFSIPGKHNLMNALAAFVISIQLGCEINLLKSALESFKGVKRRFTYHLRTKDRVYIDDYAHHPKEINSVYSAIKEIYPKQDILVAFQPHLFSRTRDFVEGFADSLSQFDAVLLLDIYPARETPIDGVSSSWLLDKINSPIKKLVDKSDLSTEILNQNMKINLTLGAGDIGDECMNIKKTLEYEN